MESGNGARADAPTSGRRGAGVRLVRITTESKRTKKSQATTHAERTKSVGIFGKKELGLILVPRVGIEPTRAVMPTTF
jgi:hypothetical protein